MRILLLKPQIGEIAFGLEISEKESEILGGINVIRIMMESRRIISEILDRHDKVAISEEFVAIPPNKKAIEALFNELRKQMYDEEERLGLG